LKNRCQNRQRFFCFYTFPVFKKAAYFANAQRKKTPFFAKKTSVGGLVRSVGKGGFFCFCGVKIVT